MSDNKNLNLENVSQGLINLLVADVMRKHNIKEKKRELSAEQKEQLKDLLDGLKTQVDQFISDSQKSDEKEEESTGARNTLRDLFRKENKEETSSDED